MTPHPHAFGHPNACRWISYMSKHGTAHRKLPGLSIAWEKCEQADEVYLLERATGFATKSLETTAWFRTNPRFVDR